MDAIEIINHYVQKKRLSIKEITKFYEPSIKQWSVQLEFYSNLRPEQPLCVCSDTDRTYKTAKTNCIRKFYQKVYEEQFQDKTLDNLFLSQKDRFKLGILTLTYRKNSPTFRQSIISNSLKDVFIPVLDLNILDLLVSFDSLNHFN